MPQTLEDIIRFMCKLNGNVPAAGVLDPGSFIEKQQPVDKTCHQEKPMNILTLILI